MALVGSFEAASEREHVPGTELMRDVRSGDNATERVMFVPNPSASKADPLNWSLTWKIIVASSQLIYCWVGVTSALSLAPVFPLLGAEFHLNQQQLSLLTGLDVITLGFANLLIVPISNIFGRRMTSILFGTLLILTCIWESLATSHKSLLASRACNGIAAATSESIMVQIIADMFFLRERGTWMGIYFTTYFMGAFLGPIMSGNIAAIHGWRSSFWLSTALSSFASLLVIVGQPETKYHRDQRRRPIPSIPAASSSKKRNSFEDTTETDGNPKPDSVTEVCATQVGKGRPSRKQFALWRLPDQHWKQFVIRDITTPIRIFFNPVVFWAGLMLAGPANLVLIYNLTESSTLGTPPYNWSAGAVGYANFGFVVGGLVGVATAGPLSDWVANRATQKNNGVREAEMRLPTLIPYACLTILTHVLGGIAIQHHWSWEAIVVVGYGFSALSATSVPTIALAFAIDCFKPVSGEIMVVATVLKNVLGFCLSYWIFDLSAKATNGWITVFMVQFACTMLPIVLTIPLYLYGKKIRRYYRNSDLHRMEEMI